MNWLLSERNACNDKAIQIRSEDDNYKDEGQEFLENYEYIEVQNKEFHDSFVESLGDNGYISSESWSDIKDDYKKSTNEISWEKPFDPADPDFATNSAHIRTDTYAYIGSHTENDNVKTLMIACVIAESPARRYEELTAAFSLPLKIQGVDPSMADAAGQVLTGYFFGKIGESLSAGWNSFKNIFTNNKGARSTYSNFARQATRNANSTEVVLGKYNQGGVSYTKVAEQQGATYFQLDNWDYVVKEVGEKNIWNINESFIRQQASANKTFILSHDPAQATGYFAKEVNLLKDMGYDFIKEGSVWRALK